MTRIKIALLLMSAIFMMYWIILFIGFIFHLMPIITTLYLSFWDWIVLLSIISFFGSVLFLAEARKVLSKWYLAVPLCISLLLLVIVNSGAVFNTLKGNAEILWTILLMLLSPFSLLVFISLRRHPYSMHVYVAVSFVVSLLSMIFIFNTLQYFSIGSDSDGFFILKVWYWFLVMPITGLCFLASAIIHENPENILSLETAEPAQI